MDKWVYRFDEGDRSMLAVLGGKGAGLAEMSRAGLPVLGFTEPWVGLTAAHFHWAGPVLTVVTGQLARHRPGPFGAAASLAA